MLRKGLILSGVTLIVISGLATTTPALAAAKEKVLWNFNYEDGFWLLSGVVFDASGNLYGTTLLGGAYNSGTVFELSPGTDGTWTEEVLYSFEDGTDGADPRAGVIFGADGNLYGLAQGGTHHDGVAFELVPNADGTWTHKVLYEFGSQKGDGISPQASMVADAAGNLYGTTAWGGTGSCVFTGVPGCGTVFRLSRGKGQWTERVLYSFRNNRKDGNFPFASLTWDAAGNLYGTTSEGGIASAKCFNGSCGTVFRLTPRPHGKWTESILHYFKGHDGSDPASALTIDAASNLYGTTGLGGELGCYPPYGCGTVFELSLGANGKWTHKALRSFHRERFPSGGVIFDAAGNLYVTTWSGGRYDYGSLMKLTPGANGAWSTAPVYSFGAAGDGTEPTGSLVSDSSGSLYGMTHFGGDADGGTVFEITP